LTRRIDVLNNKRRCVEAKVAGMGHIKRFTVAASRSQAIFQVARVLEKENPGMRIFLDKAKVTPEN